MNNRNSTSKALLVAAGLLAVLVPAAAETPKLNIRTKNGSPIEEQKKQQIERLAKQYDLKKLTITRDIIIEQGVRPHSSPVLTLNGRFLDNDDLALSVYIHEQGHWLLMERHGAHINDLYNDLKRAVPGLPTDFPQGSGDERGTYIHLAVILLEWQGMEGLVGAERARKVMDFQKTDHYTAIYSAVLEHRQDLEKVLLRYSIKW
jgi:hypothetical protein